MKLLSEKSEEVSEISNETENRPIVSPETEGLLACVALERQICLSEWNQHHNCVVDQTG